jgi:hypothetical protein
MQEKRGWLGLRKLQRDVAMELMPPSSIRKLLARESGWARNPRLPVNSQVSGIEEASSCSAGSRFEQQRICLVVMATVTATVFSAVTTAKTATEPFLIPLDMTLVIIAYKIEGIEGGSSSPRKG